MRRSRRSAERAPVDGKHKRARFAAKSNEVHGFVKDDVIGSEIDKIFTLVEAPAAVKVMAAKPLRGSSSVVEEEVQWDAAEDYSSAFGLAGLGDRTVLVQRDTEDLSIPELRKELKARGLATDGARDVLLKRLEDAIVEEQSAKKGGKKAEKKVEAKEETNEEATPKEKRGRKPAKASEAAKKEEAGVEIPASKKQTKSPAKATEQPKAASSAAKKRKSPATSTAKADKTTPTKKESPHGKKATPKKAEATQVTAKKEEKQAKKDEKRSTPKKETPKKAVSPKAKSPAKSPSGTKAKAARVSAKGKWEASR